MYFTAIICIILIVLFLYYLVLRYSHAGRLMAKIPGIRSNYPLLGNMFDYIGTADELFKSVREIWKTNKGITKLSTFHFKYVHIYDPKDIETILSSSRSNIKEMPYNFLKVWLQEGLLVSNGHKWLHRRRTLTPAFHFSVLKQYLISFTERTNNLLEKIKNNYENKETDVIKLLSITTLSIMCEAAMGTSTSTIQNEVDKYFKGIEYFGNAFVYRLCRPWLYLDWLFNLTTRSREQVKVAKELHGVTDKIIYDREAAKSKAVRENDPEFGKRRMGMLDVLLECQAEGTIDHEGIREEVDTFLFEGHDTTALAQSYMLLSLAHAPYIQENIFNELITIFGDSERDPEPEDLKKMKYLECCIKETLRLYPSVPTIARRLVEEVELGGYKIPVDTICYIHMYDMHRNPEIFPDPESFIPERFTPENKAKRHPYSYLPFSAGPRNCIGQKFAMMEMKTMMSGLIRRYRFEPITQINEITYMTDLVLRSKYPIYVKFVRR